MLPKYIQGAHMIYLCYDITDPQSFADVVSSLFFIACGEEKLDKRAKP
jgi:GTPase SAR1 family protein